MIDNRPALYRGRLARRLSGRFDSRGSEPPRGFSGRSRTSLQRAHRVREQGAPIRHRVQCVRTRSKRTADQVATLEKAGLDRIDQGTYGHCANCGKDIEEKRLEAVPYAAVCIDCASAG